MAQRFRVTYSDGTVEEIKATPRAQVQTERFLREQGGYSNSTLVEAGYRLAYESSKPGIGNVDYEGWLDKIDDVERLCPSCGEAVADDDDTIHTCPAPARPGEAGQADPTPEAPSPTPSSD